MTVEVVPTTIDLSTLTGGFAPDPEEGSLPLDCSPDLLNLDLDPGSGAVELRKGFTRLSAGRLSALAASHWIRHLNYYELIDGGARKRYLIAVCTNGTDASANNIRIYAYDLINNTFTRIDTAGRSWAKAKTEHWYAIIEGTYYGGTRGEVMYSWHPTAGWDADPTTPSVRTWVDNVGDAAGDPASYYARDYAFKKGQKALYSSKYYSALRSIRYDDWDDDSSYRTGHRVSRKVDWGTYNYWASFECIKAHAATAGTGAATGKPGEASGYKTYWKKLKLRNIKNEDGEVSADWAYMPLPGKSSVGVYHGGRLWVRHDDADNWARAQYSAPSKPEKDALIADLDWVPTDWAPVDDLQGDGGGWLTMPFGKGDAIRAMFSFGSYLIFFGRWQTFVLSGTNEQTWNLRQLTADGGAYGPQCVAELDGLVYFIGPKGELQVTDGTQVRVVDGMEKVREWFKDRVDQLMLGEDTNNWHPTLTAYNDRLIISLPDNDGTDYTLVYRPDTKSWWLWDIPILDATVGEKGRAQRMWFSTAITGGVGQSPCVFQYLDDPGDFVFTDDDPDGGSSTLTTDITWRYRTSWFSFGARHLQRRLRRLWALVSGEAASTVTVRMYRDHNPTYLTTVNRTLTGQATVEAEHVEGKVGPTTAAHSVGVRLSGTANAQVAIHGVGLDTEPLRERFHRN